MLAIYMAITLARKLRLAFWWVRGRWRMATGRPWPPGMLGPVYLQLRLATGATQQQAVRELRKHNTAITEAWRRGEPF